MLVAAFPHSAKNTQFRASVIEADASVKKHHNLTGVITIMTCY